MMRSLVFISAVIVLDLAANGILVDGLGLHSNLAWWSNNTLAVCTDFDALVYSHEFHNCMIDKKYPDIGPDYEKIVDKTLRYSDVCIQNFSRSCRPDYKGFLGIMDKLIYQMKDYCTTYLESITKNREKIKDLDCVEQSLSNETYRRCFHETFENGTSSSEEEFQKKVEKSISCTNKSHKLCSRDAKVSLNKLVRIVLKVKQPEKEDIEEEKPPRPWKWYDYIIQPIISLWRSITSFFGF